MFRFRLQPTPYTIVTFGMLSGQRSTLGNGLSGELRNMYETLQILGYSPYQLVQDFFHQQYDFNEGPRFFLAPINGGVSNFITRIQIRCVFPLIHLCRRWDWKVFFFGQWTCHVMGSHLLGSDVWETKGWWESRSWYFSPLYSDTQQLTWLAGNSDTTKTSIMILPGLMLIQLWERGSRYECILGMFE